MLLFVLQLSWCVLLYVPCEAWLLALYDYDDLLIISILRYFSRSSEVLLNSQLYITFIYISLPTFNSDELVTLRGKIQKISLTLFIKAGRYRWKMKLLKTEFGIGYNRTRNIWPCLSRLVGFGMRISGNGCVTSNPSLFSKSDHHWCLFFLSNTVYLLI